VNARYAEVDRARTQLLAMLGHDLRGPLNSISMAATVLQHGGQQDKMGLRIQNATGRMQRLVSQVLDLSRIRSGLGLGLYIAREIVAGHHGTISYHYVDPHVVFTVSLPLSGPSGRATSNLRGARTCAEASGGAQCTSKKPPSDLADTAANPQTGIAPGRRPCSRIRPSAA
jgi:signal transduction histidine kinase